MPKCSRHGVNGINHWRYISGPLGDTEIRKLDRGKMIGQALFFVPHKHSHRVPHPGGNKAAVTTRDYFIENDWLNQQVPHHTQRRERGKLADSTMLPVSKTSGAAVPTLLCSWDEVN
jgi:hypothetical protein